jgi:hypothetical protein
MELFPDEHWPGGYRAAARRELRRVCLELAMERERADALRRAAQGRPDLLRKADAADVRAAALRAHAAQLRRAAGRRAAA